MVDNGLQAVWDRKCEFIEAEENNRGAAKGKGEVVMLL